MKKLMRIGILVVVGTLLFSPNIPLAAQGQMQDSSRRSYDRVMEEFKHRDYEAALAGFRVMGVSLWHRGAPSRP